MSVSHTIMASPHHSSLQWRLAIHSLKVGRHLSRTLEWPLKWHHPLLPPWTVQWHPAMAPCPLRENWSSPSASTIACFHGSLRWHHVHCTLQGHPGATSNAPKWFVAFPFIGSMNLYSSCYLGKNWFLLSEIYGSFFSQDIIYCNVWGNNKN